MLKMSQRFLKISVRLAIAAFCGVLISVAISAQEPDERTFASSHDASKALHDAVKAGDKAAIEAVLGASSAPIISSGDTVADQKNREFFVQHYEQMNR